MAHARIPAQVPQADRLSGDPAGFWVHPGIGGGPSGRVSFPPMQRRRVVYFGRVQGVGFRATARSTASRHAVTGWVRNEPDGSVVLEAQGLAHVVDGFLLDVHRRMESFIQRTGTETIALVEGEAGFAIRR